MVEEIQFPTGFVFQDILSWGSIGMICLDQTSQTIVKSAHDESDNKMIDVEKRIYERFEEQGGHPGLLRYHGPYDQACIRLEYALKGDVHAYICEHPTIDHVQRLQWAKQVTEALAFVHRVGVIHGDFTCKNIFLDKDLNAKVADFSGSSLDGSPLMVVVTSSHALPTKNKLTVKADLFALGSVLFEIMTSTVPHGDLEDDEMEKLYRRGIFPDTSRLGAVGRIITRCWHGSYDDTEAVLCDLNDTDPALPVTLLPISAILVTSSLVAAYFLARHRLVKP